MSKRLGWIPDLPDGRDFPCMIQPVRGLPLGVDLRAQYPACYDQGDSGSCTGNGVAGAMEFDQIKQKLKFEFTPARLFLYWNGRAYEGSTDYDSGAMIRDVVKGANAFGAPPESDWPFDVSQVTTKPSDLAYLDAKLHQALHYARLNTAVQQIKAVLASNFPIAFGFSVYESFMSDEVAATGIMPMPRFSSENFQGGHCVDFAGYQDRPWVDLETQRQMPRGLICRNSWGVEWGLKGYFVMPYEYITPNLVDDLWQIDVVS